jgi:hypothetical protein
MFMEVARRLRHLLVEDMTAPRPLMVQQCHGDGLYPPGGMQDSVRKIAVAYHKAGVSDRFQGVFFDGPHRFDQPMQETAFNWLDQHLKQDEA